MLSPRYSTLDYYGSKINTLDNPPAVLHNDRHTTDACARTSSRLEGKGLVYAA